MGVDCSHFSSSCLWTSCFVLLWTSEQYTLVLTKRFRLKPLKITQTPEEVWYAQWLKYCDNNKDDNINLNVKKNIVNNGSLPANSYRNYPESIQQ